MSKSDLAMCFKARFLSRTIGLKPAIGYLKNRGVDCSTAVYWLFYFKPSKGGNMNKHTEGPWDVVTADRGYIITALGGVYDVAVVRNIGHQDNQANARLISAAPNLLAALEAIFKNDGNHVFVSGSMEQAARSAISKAKGEL